MTRLGLLGGTARCDNTKRPLTPSLDYGKEGLAMDATQSEEWRPVVGYEGIYEVSDRGRVKSLAKRVRCHGGYRTRAERIHRPTDHPQGYKLVGLWLDGRQYTARVHVLVLEAFVGPRTDGMVACHNDGNPANNRLHNLRWDTQSNNILDAIKHGNHRANWTHCEQGHEFTEANTIVARNGWRRCRACTNANQNRRARERRRRLRLGSKT